MFLPMGYLLILICYNCCSQPQFPSKSAFVFLVLFPSWSFQKTKEGIFTWGKPRSRDHWLEQVLRSVLRSTSQSFDFTSLYFIIANWKFQANNVPRTCLRAEFETLSTEKEFERISFQKFKLYTCELKIPSQLRSTSLLASWVWVLRKNLIWYLRNATSRKFIYSILKV